MPRIIPSGCNCVHKTARNNKNELLQTIYEAGFKFLMCMHYRLIYILGYNTFYETDNNK